MGDPTLTREAILALRSPLAERVELHEEIGSTQSRAREIAREGAPHGTLVVARVQKGGRGRLGRGWGSPSGGLWMSLVLRPYLPARFAPRVTQTAAVGVAKALRSLGVEARIKWPNDLLVARPGDPEERKICGILAESGFAGKAGATSFFVVLGIGLNANLDPWEVSSGDYEATTVRAELGRDVNLATLIEAVLSRLDHELGRIQDFPAVLADWRDLNVTLGREVRVQRYGETLEGRAVDLTSEGGLILETAAGPVEVFEGEVEHLRHQE